jgi:plastocyanin
MKPGLSSPKPARRRLLVALGAAALIPLAAAATRPKVITIEAMRFSPAVLEVAVGDTVVWKNKDPFPHNVVADGAGFRSTDIPADGSWSYRPARAGVFPYACTLHPGMRATITVKARR